jgi:hypothetical protein
MARPAKLLVGVPVKRSGAAAFRAGYGFVLFEEIGFPLLRRAYVVRSWQQMGFHFSASFLVSHRKQFLYFGLTQTAIPQVGYFSHNRGSRIVRPARCV